ncbi:MAG: hypothetical protein QFE16_12415, partial [Pseudomonadota bacterium]|nr:hypothetical protein [Pseudomonadota bacterium]
MKIVTRLNLLSLASVLAMTLAVVVAAVLFFQGAQQQAYERLMRLEWQHTALAIQQRLNRSGVVAASEEVQSQLLALRAKDGFASASIVVVERNDNRVVFDPEHRVGERTDEAVVNDMMRLQKGTLQYASKGLRRMVVFDTLEPIHWLVGVSVLRSEVDAS